MPDAFETPEPPPAAASAFAQALQLRHKLIIERRRTAALLQAVAQQRQEPPPPLVDWVRRCLQPPEPSPTAPSAPQEAMTQEIMVQVLRRYNWEPLPRSHRSRGGATDVPP